MDPRTIFAAVSLTILANGIGLVMIYRDLPVRLRPAAFRWQAGTVLIAIGCIGFAFGHMLPRPLLLTMVNSAFVFGLTFYLKAIQSFYGYQTHAWQFLPGLVTGLCVYVFSAIYPHFGVRVVIVSLIWLGLMGATIHVMLINGRFDPSLSRKMLIAIFCLVSSFIVFRIFYYVIHYFTEEFDIDTGQNWVNLVSPIVTTLIPITGTTSFTLMCSDYLRRQLELAAATDPLTGLSNRRVLVEQGTGAFQRVMQKGGGFAVAIMDIDRFKAINDSYGHETGDKALIHVAHLLRGQVGPSDMVARTGGEEFVVLLHEPEPSRAFAVIEAMRQAVESLPYRDGDQELPVTLSAGVSMYQPGDRNFDDVLRRADMGLYMAKSSGRNRTKLMA